MRGPRRVLLLALLACVVGGVFTWQLQARLKRERTFLRACAEGQIRTVRRLLDEDRSLARLRTSANLTPLHLAVDGYQLDAVEALLERGADPGARGNGNLTPLLCATQRGFSTPARQLLEAGAPVDEPDMDGWSPLHWAVCAGSEGLAGLLVHHGADPGRKDSSGRSPLDLALRMGPPSMLERLAPGRADREGIRMAPLQDLAARGRTRELQAAVRAVPSRICAQDAYGYNVLHWAYRERHDYLAENVDLSGNPYRNLATNQPGALGLTPLHFLVLGQSDSALTRCLDKPSANLEARDEDGQGPLHWALKLRDQAAVRRLVLAGADVNAEDHRHRTPLALARLYGLRDSLRLLEERGARE